MATSLFDSAPEYDSDLDTLADFVLEPTTTTPVHVPPPPSPLPNTCLCGQTTREADTDDQLYCSEACARLDAFHALTARSRSNSLAPTPVATAPTTPLGMHTPLRESLAILFAPNDSTSTPPYVPTPLSASSSHTSFDGAALPLEMSSHYRRVHAKRERMERRASEERERSRSHSRSHSKASPSLSSLHEECDVQVEREAGDDGEDHVPAPAATPFVHVAVAVQVEHHSEDEIDEPTETLEALPSFGPAPGVQWTDPFTDPSPSSPLSHELCVAPHDASDPTRETDVLSITESELSPFVAYAPVPPPPLGLRTRKSSVCFAGVDPAGGRSRAASDAKSRSRAASLSVFAEKPLPPTPRRDLPESSMERSVEVSEPTPIAEPCAMPEAPELVNPLPSPALTMDSPFQPDDASSDTPATPTSSTAPASPCTPNARIREPQSDADHLTTPSRSSSAPATRAPGSPVTPKHSPATVPRPPKAQAMDALARAKIFSMVIDPELDVFSAEVVDAVAPTSAPLKRSETAPELVLGWGPDGQPVACPQTPQKTGRARATSTPRRGYAGGRPRTTSTPAHPQLGQLQLPPRRARLQHIPPPTPPVSPSHVSSPRPVMGQDPGTWQSFGAVFDVLSSGRSVTGELHRRQESGESTASSATDASWDSSSPDYWRGRARSPATSSVRTIVPPPRGSSLARYEADDKDQLHVPRRSRRHSSIAALDSILAMEETFWATETPVLVRDSDEGEGESQGVAGVGHDAGMSVSVSVNKFTGDGGGFAFPSDKSKAPFDPVLRIAGASLLSSSPPRSRRGSGLRFDAVEHAHRLTPSNFPSSPSIGRPSQDMVEPSPSPIHAHSHLFDGPISASPLLLSARNSPALPNASPLSTHFSIRTPNSPYLSVNRRGSRSTDASSVLLRTASAARLAAALNAAPDNDDDEEELARFGARARRSGSLGHPSPRMGLGLALGDEPVRSRANSESWLGLSAPGVGTVSRSGSRMNLLNPTTSIVVEEEEEEDYGQVVDSSKFAGIVTAAPASPSGEESSPLIDAFPHPMGGYFPGSRFASRAGTPVRSLHGSNSALSLRQVAAGQVQPTKDKDEDEEDDERDEDEEVVTTVQRMRQSMQLLAAV
ncbi:hypothetical protein RhiJN_28044 [Ceratobasidium sp. AG-Ba]|nr:hypothetical protein RhiJN_28044 [Ceratobasidium sp. AG-Ba]